MNHDEIARRIPHAGRMCLLDTLLDWDETHIRCSATSHRASDHPLATQGRLLAPVAIEYAAQAMALHGGLAAPPGTPPEPGFLASARSVRLHVARLDDVDGALVVSAERLAGDGRQAMYRFALHDEAGRALVEGRATVVLNQPLPQP